MPMLPTVRQLPFFPWTGTVHQKPSAIRKLMGTRLYQTTRAMHGVWAHERHSPIPLPLGTRLAMLRRGFYSENAVVYGFPRTGGSERLHESATEYLSDFARVTRCREINEHNDFFNHKLVLRSFLLAQGVAQAETVAVVHEGQVVLAPFAPEGGEVGDGATLAAALTAHAARAGGEAHFIVKPEDGWCGEDIFRLTVTARGTATRSRGRTQTPLALETLATPAAPGAPRRLLLVERALEQGAFWRALHAGSANTVRLLTLWTPGEPAPFVARAVQRIGTAETAPTDNWSGGGIAAPVALETGRLGVGRRHPGKGPAPGLRPSTGSSTGSGTGSGIEPRAAAEARAGHYAVHPETGAAIEGAVLPGWAAIQATVLRAARTLPFNPYVGWDVLVDERGTPIIIEANGNTDLNLFQVHGGLLADPRVREFYERTGVIRGRGQVRHHVT